MKLHFLYVHPNMFTLIPYLVGHAQVVQTLIQMTRREIQILSRQLSDPFPPSGTPMPRGATVDYPRGLPGFEPILWRLMLLAPPHPNCLWQNSYKMSKYTFFFVLHNLCTNSRCLLFTIYLVSTSCVRVVRDFNREAKTRCNF